MTDKNYTTFTKTSALALSLAFLFANPAFAQNDSADSTLGGGNSQNPTQSAIDSGDSSESTANNTDSTTKDFSATRVYDLGRIERVVSGYNVYGAMQGQMRPLPLSQHKTLQIQAHKISAKHCDSRRAYFIRHREVDFATKITFTFADTPQVAIATPMSVCIWTGFLSMRFISNQLSIIST